MIRHWTYLIIRVFVVTNIFSYQGYKTITICEKRVHYHWCVIYIIIKVCQFEISTHYSKRIEIKTRMKLEFRLKLVTITLSFDILYYYLTLCQQH